MKKVHLCQEELQRLEEHEQQLHFEQQQLLKEKLVEVLELEEKARWRIAEAKIAEIQLTDDLPDNNKGNEMNDILS